ncbi:hypothetical protein [Enterococcus xiangfangensis]|uniref:hypothetical protein n=1 Tax=Enterococcus xiangfangensis TaxID=1296537 RepID=UPI00142DB6FB|nr:hypothetical protein [Enterococcus xiangfangensis]MBM7711560.1 hypothetical protein [Enterococcus xiangfangensis]
MSNQFVDYGIKNYSNELQSEVKNTTESLLNLSTIHAALNGFVELFITTTMVKK